MLFLRHLQDAGKRTQLSGSYLCVCARVCVFGFWFVWIALFSLIGLFLWRPEVCLVWPFKHQKTLNLVLGTYL